jgi:predicted amidohydrolase
MKHSLRIALFHAALKPDNLTYNCNLLQAMIRQTRSYRPDLIVTPELALSGYEFHAAIGLDWIQREVPRAIATFGELAREQEVALVLGTPCYDEQTGSYHNAAIFIDEQGQVVGHYDKIRVIPGHSEGWSRPGSAVQALRWRESTIGLLICADAYTPAIADELLRQGAEALISPAAWAPGQYGPDGEWEQRSRETGLPLLVCNRTGHETTMNFNGSSSAIVVAGRRVLDYAETAPAILICDVAADDWRLLSQEFQIIPVPPDPPGA